MALQSGSFALTPIAATGDRFTDFAPYVASINDAGVVAFQATLGDGHSGVFTGDGQSVVDVAVTASGACPVRLFSSHPDINRAGQVAVYGTLKSGQEAVLMVSSDGRVAVAPGDFGGIGPLGPTLNERGEVAVRGSLPTGQACIGLWRGGRLHAIAEAGDRFLGFEGLPVIGNDGQVVFRANLPDEQHGIFVHRGAKCVAVAITGSDLRELGRFPIIDGRGTVAFVATRGSGVAGVFSVSSERLVCIVDATSGFESFRGVLINDAGLVAFYGTPDGGQLGIYAGTDPVRHRVIGVGSSLFGATVVDFALNPVSVNERGQMAIRVALDDRRQFILRADPQA